MVIRKRQMAAFSSGILGPHEHTVTTLGLSVFYLAERDLYTRGNCIIKGGSTLSPDIQNIYKICKSKLIIIIQGVESSLVAYYITFSFYSFLVFVLNILISPLGMLQINN